MTEEIGLAQPVEYTEAERRTIATHESGHATVAWLVGKSRKLEVLSIIKRNAALGLLAHSEPEERFTQTESELQALIQIALGGLVAEQLFFGERSSGVASDLKYGDHPGRPDGRRHGHGRHPDLLRGRAGRAGQPGRQGAVHRRGPGRRGPAARGAPGSRWSGCIEANRHIVEALRDALLERDELVGDEILAVIDGAVAQPA